MTCVFHSSCYLPKITTCLKSCRRSQYCAVTICSRNRVSLATHLLQLPWSCDHLNRKYALIYRALFSLSRVVRPASSSHCYASSLQFPSSCLLMAFISQPIQSKSSSPTLPALINLLVSPFALLDSMDDLYKQALEDMLSFILTIPLLPNRLPIASLTFLAPRIPLTSLHLIDASRVISNATTVEQKIHLLANLCAFAPPRYPTLSAESLAAYLNFTLSLMCLLPTHALEPPQRKAEAVAQPVWSDDSDSDHETQVAVVSSFAAPKVRLPELDTKTRNRLQTLPSATHINSLLEAVRKHRSAQLSLFAWCVALSDVWPKQKDKIFGAVTVYGGGGLVRELYRAHVRPSPLGQDLDSTTLMSKSLLSFRPSLSSQRVCD